MSDADRKRILRQKQTREESEKQQKWEKEREDAKWAAASAIHHRYKTNLSEMIMEAAREAIKGMSTSPENPVTLNQSAKAVCL
jgi:hypothetical protein